MSAEIEPNPHVALNNARNLPRVDPATNRMARGLSSASFSGLDTNGCERLRSACCTANVGINRFSHYECTACRKPCATKSAPSDTLKTLNAINLRSQASAIISTLRPLLAAMDDSARFVSFGEVTQGYCSTCGAVIGDGLCDDCDNR